MRVTTLNFLRSCTYPGNPNLSQIVKDLKGSLPSQKGSLDTDFFHLSNITIVLYYHCYEPTRSAHSNEREVLQESQKIGYIEHTRLTENVLVKREKFLVRI